MRKLLLLFLALAATAAAPATDRVPAASLGAVVYDVCYRFAGITTKVATATITFEESEWEGKPAYHSMALIQTQPFFRLFLKAEYKAEAWYSRKDLAPLYFVHPFSDGKQSGKYEVIYDPGREARSCWSVEGGEPIEKTYEPLDKPHMELLSALMYVRFHDFKEGTAEDIVLLLPSRSCDAQIGPEDDHILLRMSGNGMMENGSGNNLLLWRSTDPDRRILRLESDLGTGSLRCTVHGQ